MSKQENFIQAVQANQGIIRKISGIYSNGVEDQKDLYQEIVSRMWHSFDSFKGDSKLSTWMYSVALNSSISYIKKEKRRAKEVRLDLEFLDQPLETDTFMQERVDMLYSTIKELNIIERGIILLFLEGKSHKEIGDITGFTANNVGTRMARIREKLKNKIKHQ
ncbi:MAG: RNA polymerase sigma factor (sigma-70 family) [Crocinitomix sp.]|jgi:RNA polymerase sigma factor (sigma-70 family)